MKIISKFKDYYDHVAGYDPDPRKIYVREIDTLDEDEKRKIKKLLDLPSNNLVYYRGKKNRNVDSCLYRQGSLYLCDRLYRVVEEVDSEDTGVYDKAYICKYHYSLNTLPKDFGEEYTTNTYSLKKMDWGKFFTPGNTKINSIVGSPIVYHGKDNSLVWFSLVKNCKLAGLGFGQVMTPQEAFTEIYNWLPFVEPDLPMGGPDDMIRWEQHGFDKKTSFRNVK